MKNFQTMAGIGQWRTSSGQVIDIHTMSDQHIKNAIGVCFKRRSFAKVRELQEELSFRLDPPFDISNFNPRGSHGSDRDHPPQRPPH